MGTTIYYYIYLLHRKHPKSGTNIGDQHTKNSHTSIQALGLVLRRQGHYSLPTELGGRFENEW